MIIIPHRKNIKYYSKKKKTNSYFNKSKRLKFKECYKQKQKRFFKACFKLIARPDIV